MATTHAPEGVRRYAADELLLRQQAVLHREQLARARVEASIFV